MSTDNTHSTSLEHLPIEIFHHIFASLSLQEIVTAFFGLNSYIDSIIRSVKGVNHAVNCNDTKAIDILHLFPTKIGRLVITHSPNVDFTWLINLRSLTIKYGTLAQLDGIRPEHFLMLEILHICSVNSNQLVDKKKSLNDLFQVILSNGFPRLRICTATGIESLDLSETWTGSPSLRLLILDLPTPLIYDQLRSLCPNLRQFKRLSPSISLSNNSARNKRVFNDIMKIKEWESEKKFILEYFSAFDTDKSFASTNNTKPDMPIIYGRILPEKDPYCLASFRVQIKLPSEYPFRVPEAIILDPIYHPNVRENGEHCCCWGFRTEAWQSRYTLIDIIKAVIKVIDSPDLEKHNIVARANEYRKNYEQFYEKALQCTLNKGRPRY